MAKRSRTRGAGSIRQVGPNKHEVFWSLGKGPDGKRIRGSDTVRGPVREAEKRLREILSSLDRGLPVANDKVTVAQWMERWFAEHIVPRAQPKTIERYRGLMDRHIIPALGGVKLARLSPSHIKAFESSLLERGMAPAGVELVHIVVSGSLRYALSMEAIWRNPAAAVSPPSRPKPELATLEISNVVKILERGRIEGHLLYPALHVVAYTGIRRGECLGLSWEGTDLEKGFISIVNSVIRTKQGIIFSPAKTERSRRRVDLDPETITVLRAHKVSQLEHRLRMGAAWEDYDLVFPNGYGQPMNPMNLTRAFQALAKKEGVSETKLHSLRHFHASVLFAQGESPVLVSRRLGHTSIKTTVDIYGHLFEGQQRQAAETFAQAMRRG